MLAAKARSAEIWNIWREHHRIEQFWRLLKSVFRLKTIQLRDDGLYAGLLIKVIAYLMVGRLLSQKAFKNLSVVQLLRKIRRECNLDDFMEQYFHCLLGGTHLVGMDSPELRMARHHTKVLLLHSDQLAHLMRAKSLRLS